MSIDLSAFRFAKTANTDKQAAETAKKNLGATNGRMLFQNSEPVVKAITEGLKAQAPVKPVSLDRALVSKAVAEAARSIQDSVTRAVAAITAPVAPKVPSAPVAPAALAQRNTGNPPSVPLTTETMRRKEGETKEAARKSAQKVAADRELVTRGTARVLAYRALDVTLSDNALLVLNHAVTAWEGADRRPVPLSLSAVADAAGLSFTAVRAAIAELGEKKALIVSKDSAGVTRYQPGLGITGVRQ